MSYSVYAKLPDGRTIKYGKKLNSVTEVNAAMNEMKKDLKDAGITAKVGYQNDNPPGSVEDHGREKPAEGRTQDRCEKDLQTRSPG